MKRVVITGVGAVTPLGTSAISSWNSLIRNESGLSRLSLPKLPDLTAGLVPPSYVFDEAGKYIRSKKYLLPFMQYGISAAEEALQDAGWTDLSPAQQLRTVPTLSNNH